MESVFTTKNSNQTKKLGEVLAKEVLKSCPVKQALVFGLKGDLGGGKTTFLQGFARGLGLKDKITSPTFVILKKFKVQKSKTEFPLTKKMKVKKEKKFSSPFGYFIHIDCYRIQKAKEISDLGFEEIISDPKNIVAIEWAERIKNILPKNIIWIEFDFINKNTRKIVVKSR